MVAALGIVVPSPEADRPRLVAALQVAARGIGAHASLGLTFRPAEAGRRRPSPRAFTDPMTDPAMRTRSPSSVPARPGCCSSHLLAADGVESVVVETRSEEYVASPDPGRHPRAVDGRPAPRPSAWATGSPREGDQHRGIYLQWPEERHHLDFVDLTGRVGLGLRPDRGAEGPGRRPRRRRAGDPLRGQRHRAARPRDATSPSVTFVDAAGTPTPGGRRRRRRLRRLVRPEPARRSRTRSGRPGRRSTPTPGSASSPTWRPPPTS